MSKEDKVLAIARLVEVRGFPGEQEKYLLCQLLASGYTDFYAAKYLLPNNLCDQVKVVRQADNNSPGTRPRSGNKGSGPSSSKGGKGGSKDVSTEE